MTAPAAPRTVIGVDVGGTKTLALRVALADGSDLSPAAVRMPVTLDRELTGSSARSDEAYDRIESAVAVLMDRAAVSPEGLPGAIGVGLAGFIGHDGIARSAPNTPGLIGVDVPGRLHERFGLPVVVDNDANCVAVAARAAFAPTSQTMVAVTLGTGIGAGIIIGGRLLRGANGFAGEPGHMVVDPDGPLCPCGQHGCWERYASGSGLGWLARTAAVAGRADGLVALAGSVEAIRGEHVTDLLDAGDPREQSEMLTIFTEYAGYVALGIANLIVLLDPEVVVVGGGLAAQGDRLFGPVRAALDERFPSATDHRSVRLVVAPEGPDAGALGAALLAGDRPA